MPFFIDFNPIAKPILTIPASIKPKPIQRVMARVPANKLLVSTKPIKMVTMPPTSPSHQ